MTKSGNKIQKRRSNNEIILSSFNKLYNIFGLDCFETHIRWVVCNKSIKNRDLFNCKQYISTLESLTETLGFRITVSVKVKKTKFTGIY